MATDRIEGIRTTQFPTERRGGYERGAVDAYLADLADWLESDEAKAAIAQRELGRVGERTGSILSAAQESADRMVSEATAEAQEKLAEAERLVAEQRAAADAYAEETRSAADEEARTAREDAAADAERTREEADEHARLTIREADDRLERAAREAEERTAGVQDEIAALAAQRTELLANLEELAGGLRAVIDGPGKADLKLPERSRTAAAFTEPVAHQEISEAPQVEPAPVEDEPDTADDWAIADEDTVAEEPPTIVEVIPEMDTDEELYEDGRPPDPLPSGRDPARSSRPPRDPDDPTTDDQKLTELL